MFVKILRHPPPACFTHRTPPHHKLWQFNDAEDTASFPPLSAADSSAGVANSTVIIGYDTSNMTWRRTSFDKSPHDVQVTVSGDNAHWFGGDGRIKLKVRLKNFFISLSI